MSTEHPRVHNEYAGVRPAHDQEAQMGTVRRDATSVADGIAGATTGDELFSMLSESLRTVLPYDGAAWFATDPSTVMATSPVRIENVEGGHCESYWEREFHVEDVLLFRDIARSESGVGTLYDATNATPGRSTRSREFLAPQGYGDELRAAFRTGEHTWGVVDLFRYADRPAFSREDTDLVRAIAPAVSTALRSLAITAASPAEVEFSTPGTLIYDNERNLVSFDEAGERWLTVIADGDWATYPTSLSAVFACVARAQMIAAGREQGPASARFRTPDGVWLVVHASCLRTPDGGPGNVAVTIGPAKSAQIAPIIVEAYGLTAREQEIARAVSRGLQNADIAAQMFLSPHTVRDHLKAIFGKLEVRSRGELVAKIFADAYEPTLHAPEVAATCHHDW
jgi:DNA-binding CsgD family transcriptional regulator